MKVEVVAGWICLGLLCFLTALGAHLLVRGVQVQFAQNLLLLIGGAVVAAVSGFFAAGKERFVFEQPANYAATVEIKARER